MARDGSIWFAAADEGTEVSLYRVKHGAKPVVMLSSPGQLLIQAISGDGRVLVSQGDVHMRLLSGKFDEPAEHELSWLDWSLVHDITPDGKMILLDESGQGGGPKHSVFMRPTAGGPAVRLGDGLACAFSPDQKSVLAAREDGLRGR